MTKEINKPEKVLLRPPTSGGFKPGQSGNPAGRAAGSRNRATMLAYALMEEGGDQVIQKIMECQTSH